MAPGRKKCTIIRFEEHIENYSDVIKNSEMFKHLCIKLDEIAHEISKIRCLAIGSFAQDFQARYQMAFLLNLVSYLNFSKAEDSNHVSVSIYDPVFDERDLKYIADLGSQWTVDPITIDNKDTIDPPCKDILFFLPHAPLDLTQTVILQEQPLLLLANNLTQHTDRYTKSKLYDKYPIISKLVHILDNNDEQLTSKDKVEDSNLDGFTVIQKESRRRNRKNKSIKFTEPTINYDAIDSYFTNIKIRTTFDDGKLLKDQPWINSFSDLALHEIYN